MTVTTCCTHAPRPRQNAQGYPQHKCEKKGSLSLVKKEVNTEVKRAIKAAKQESKNKVEGKMTQGNLAQLDRTLKTWPPPTGTPSVWKQPCSKSPSPMT